MIVLLLYFSIFTHETCSTSYEVVKMTAHYTMGGFKWEADYLEVLSNCSSVTRSASGNYTPVEVRIYE